MAGFRLRGVALFVVSVVAAISLAGCTGEPPKGAVDPGVDTALLGGIEVVGYLVDQAGTWAVLDADPNGAGSRDPGVLATLVPGSVDEGGIEALDGRYIWAAGRSSGGDADTPEIKVDGIDTAVEPQ